MACVGKMPGFRFHSRHATQGENVSAMETEVLCVADAVCQSQAFYLQPNIPLNFNFLVGFEKEPNATKYYKRFYVYSIQ